MKTLETQPNRYAFDEKEHLHTLDGKPLTGVTTVLSVIAKPALVPWASKCATDWIKKNTNKCEKGTLDAYEYYLVTDTDLEEARNAHRKKKESAGDWGTKIHERIEELVKESIETGKLPVFQTRDIEDKKGDAAINHFLKWAHDNKVKFLASEKNIYSESWWVGGIADIVCEIDGKLYIGDIKTSSDIYPEFFLQTSAYAKMAVEMGLYEKFDGVIIINLDKKGGFKTKTFYNVQQGIEVFESALKIYRFKESVTI